MLGCGTSSSFSTPIQHPSSAVTLQLCTVTYLLIRPDHPRTLHLQNIDRTLVRLLQRASAAEDAWLNPYLVSSRTGLKYSEAFKLIFRTFQGTNAMHPIDAGPYNSRSKTLKGDRIRGSNYNDQECTQPFDEIVCHGR